jgi:lysophospholipase L1-like esterase
MNRQTGALMLVGDSDIARWPSDLLPKSDTLLLRQTLTRGHSGATLQEIVPCVQEALEVIQPAETIVLVACAGENDIGSGCSLSDTLSALQELIRLFFRNDANEAKNKRLVFLGPKLEPWLDNDPVSRKKYAKLSTAFQRACKKNERANEIIYVDCLLMFCGESGKLPGATLGGKAKAERHYFDSDQLHLSREGYQVWKRVVENHLSCIVWMEDGSSTTRL